MSASGPDRLADALERHGLSAPAALLLATHRPLLPLLRQATTFLGPLLPALLGDHRDDLESLVEDPRGYDRLVRRLDRGSRTDGGRRA